MSIVKNVEAPFSKRLDLKNEIRYAIDPNHCREGITGAQGILKTSVDGMYKQMEQVKVHFHKESGRQAFHLIVSFSIEEMKYIGIREAQQIGYKVCEYFNGYQIVFGVHTNEDNLHIHFAMNPVSFVDGKKYSLGVNTLWDLKRYVNQCVRHYNPYSMDEIINMLEN